ncbi:MAG TPA: toll/interleukin-1 receptor domain-containing protein, partial [Anaerolineales bacterium]|nr:toll/interleukin-1 receptor domain-containing protein [Anaerolineales bacterium]
MPDTYAYDLYLSFSPEDARWAREWLLPRLEDAGLRVFVDYRDARPGASKITEMERAMLESAKTLLILTPAYLKGDWNDFQSIMIQYLDPAGRQQRLLPLILKEVTLPLRLNMLVPLDFTDPAEREGQMVRLLGAFGVERLRGGGDGEKRGKGEEERERKGEEEKREEGEEEKEKRPVGAWGSDPVLVGMVRDLKGYLQRGRLVLFVGPDLPQEI